MSINKIQYVIQQRYPSVYPFVKYAYRILRMGGAKLIMFRRKCFSESYYKKRCKDVFKSEWKFPTSDNSIDYPTNVVIEINNTCNLNCPMCSTHQGKRKKGEMSIDLFQKIIEKLSKTNLSRTLTLHTIGEPLFNSNLVEIFKICKNNGFNILLTTNGLLLHEHIDLIKEYPGMVSRINFSIDGATEQTYNKLRKGGKFEQLLNNLELIHNYNLHATINEKIPIHLQSVISNENINEIPLFFKVYGKYFLPDEMTFHFLTNHSATHSQSEYYSPKKLTTDKLERLNVPCAMLWQSTHILYNGDVSACCRDYNGELIVGNIFNQSITEIWNGDIYNKYRNMHLRKDVAKIPSCRDCYSTVHEAGILMNNYIQYIINKFPGQSDVFYEKCIMNRLNYLNDYFSEDFIKQGKYNSMFSAKML